MKTSVDEGNKSSADPANSPDTQPGNTGQQSASAYIPRGVALNIALAARAMPDIEIEQLLKGLLALVGEPLSTAKLAKLNLISLKKLSFLEEMDVAYLQTALAILQGQDDELGQQGSANDRISGHKLESASAHLPEIQPPFADFDDNYADQPTDTNAVDSGELPQKNKKRGYVQVACASNNSDWIDGHFGSCARFLIYQVAPKELRLVDIRTPGKPAAGEDKNAQRAGFINDCQILYTVSIGGPAAAKVVRAGLHPIKVPEGGAAPQILDRLRTVIGESPPPWLAKAMGMTAKQRTLKPEGIDS